jgi:hypothetical protein
MSDLEGESELIAIRWRRLLGPILCSLDDQTLATQLGGPRRRLTWAKLTKFSSLCVVTCSLRG